MFKKLKEKLKSKTGITLLVIVVLLVSIRVAMPYVVKHYINKELGNMDGYYGHVDDVDINLFRGAYVLEELEIEQVNDGISTPFVYIPDTDISIEWRALFNGAIVAEIYFEEPRLNFIAGQGTDDPQTGEGVDWRQQVKDIVPLQINRLEIVNGSVHYMEVKSEPNIDLPLTEVNAYVNNLTNSMDLSGSLVANGRLRAKAFGGAPLDINLELDPYDSLGTFDIDVTLEAMDITEMNKLVEKYAKFDIAKGNFSLYAEVKAEKGLLNGYLKPLIKDIDIREKPENDPLWQDIWEGIVGITAKIIENRKEDQIGTEVPFEGDLNSPDFNLFNTVTGLLRNAFIEALKPSLNNSISFSNKQKDQKNG